ncbi:hypothetical protein J3F82_004552 [Coemansia sp. RSA 637]|nr:hypothetical protein J3F82_004552 [Coemansia sp. RSA 637]
MSARNIIRDTEVVETEAVVEAEATEAAVEAAATEATAVAKMYTPTEHAQAMADKAHRQESVSGTATVIHATFLGHLLARTILTSAQNCRR